MTANQDNSGPFKIAVVYGSLPSVEEIEQLAPFIGRHQIDIVSSESIVNFLAQSSIFEKINCVVLPDHDDSPTFLPGLEKVLADYQMVIVKERLGIYAYQVVKAKWRHKFKLITWIDNIQAFPANDANRLRTVRNEITSVSDGFLVQSKAAKETLLLEGIREDNIHFLSPYVHEKREPKSAASFAIRKELGFKDSDFVIACYGQIEWEENILELLHSLPLAFELEKSLRHRLKILILGVGSYLNEIKQRAVFLGLSDAVTYMAPSSKTINQMLHCADLLYYSPQISKDRLDGDPFRLLTAMAHSIPVLASRSPLAIESVSKHRLDFFQGLPSSIARALQKGIYAKGLLKDLALKNKEKIEQRFTREQFATHFVQMLDKVKSRTLREENSSIDERILQVENRIGSKQFMEAIDLIEATFKKEVEIPRHHKSNLYRLIGDCFTKLGDGESGKNSYLQAIDIDSYAPKAHIGLGTISLTKNKFDIGVIHFQKAVSLAPNDEMANLGLGLAFQGLDELQEANKWVIKTLEINPQNSAALYTIIKIGHDLGQYIDAEKALRKYLQLRPDDDQIAYSLAGILYKQGKYQDVLDIVEAIVKVNPMDGQAQSLVKQARKALAKVGKKTSAG